MSPGQARLIDDVRARFGPKAAITDRADVTPWETDWRGRFHGHSPAILAPADRDEAQAIVVLAHDIGVALVPQGGNTSMVGGATPPEDGSALILTTRRMNRIRRLDAGAGLAVVEAGVILSDLHDAAAAADRRFPLTLGSKGSATIGGLVSTNAGGTQVLRWGTMRGLVAGIEAVLPDGSLYEALSALKKDNRGYDLTQLLIGAEGTLGLVTAASLRLASAVPDRAVGWVGVETPARALDLLRVMEHRSGSAIEGFELVPRESLQAVLAHVSGTRAPLASDVPWLVLCEYVGPDAGERLAELISDGATRGLVLDAVISANEAQAEAFWHIRDSISEGERKSGPAVQHDISVPVDAMPAFMVDAGAALEAAFPGVRASGFGHLGDGNVHFHVRAPVGVDAGADAERWRRDVGEPATRMVHDLVVAAGGSISAEHGIGQMKLAELRRLTPPARLSAQRAVKRALDPAMLFNPGKLIV